MFLLESSLISGVISGFIYALAGIALIVIYRVSGYVSFAQGDIAALALYAGYWLHSGGLPYLLVALGVVVAGAVIGGVVGSLVVVPLERFGILVAAISTIGVSVMIQGGENLLFGADARSFPSAGQATAFSIGPVGVSRADALSLVVCVAVVAALSVAFRRTRAGVAMRAVHGNADAAMVLGLDAKRLKRVSWMVAGGLAGLCGLFIAPIYALTPTSVNSILVFGFAALVIGGFDSLYGAVISGVLIGFITNLTAAYISPNLVTALLFVALVVILILRPHGLFGRAPVVRV
ncbi:MAG: branched-chain amino acid ABC transporter permease [Nocardioides sp.]|uniref:branched-chain amino acid ABC transporter permease n=1 Tax=Nocardioides sp. TaxID=35761 RepID=UPI0039E66C75